MLIRVARSARKHKIGAARIRHVMATSRPISDGNALWWVGHDDRGLILEIKAVPDDRNPGGLTVIHAMPLEFRERRK